MSEDAGAGGGAGGSGAAAGAAGAGGAGAAAAAAGAGAVAAGADAAGAAAATPVWYSGLDKDTSGWLQNKQWFGSDFSKADLTKGIAEWAKSTRGLESMMGRNRLAAPRDVNDTEAHTALYKALGHPADKAGYEIKLPDGGNQSYQDAMLDVFHKEGLSVRQAQAIAKVSNELGMQSRTEAEAQFVNQSTADLEGQKKEWGAQSDANFAAAQRFTTAFGIDKPTMEKIERAMGTKPMLQLFSKIGTGLTEDRGAGVGSAASAGVARSPEAAQARINELNQDKEWTKRYLAGGATERREYDQLLSVLADAA